jgi:ABC-type transport system involved in multi-copper enzyme maturation permease subunit
MISRVWAAYQFELGKAAHRRGIYAGPFAIIVLFAGMWYQYTRGETDIDGLRFIAFATPVTLNLLGLMLILAFSAGLVASEVSAGTLRLPLTRPIRRNELLAGKILLAMTYAILLTGLVGALSWSVAIGVHGVSAVEYGGEVWFTGTQMFWTYCICAALGLAPLFAACAYGAMWSTLMPNAGSAITAAIVSWFLIDLIKEPFGVAPYLFTSYIETSWRVFADRCDLMDPSWTPNAYRSIAASAAAFFTCGGIAHLAFDRRNICK